MQTCQRLTEHLYKLGECHDVTAGVHLDGVIVRDAALAEILIAETMIAETMIAERKGVRDVVLRTSQIW